MYLGIASTLHFADTSGETQGPTCGMYLAREALKQIPVALCVSAQASPPRQARGTYTKPRSSVKHAMATVEIALCDRYPATIDLYTHAAIAVFTPLAIMVCLDARKHRQGAEL